VIINFTFIAIKGPTAASIATYLVPAVALALGIVVLNEPARLTLSCRTLINFAGVVCVRVGSKQNSASRSSAPDALFPASCSLAGQ
jgi:hypothetical protein